MLVAGGSLEKLAHSADHGPVGAGDRTVQRSTMARHNTTKFGSVVGATLIKSNINLVVLCQAIVLRRTVLSPAPTGPWSALCASFF